MNLAELFIAINSFFKGMGFNSDNKIYLITITIIFILAFSSKISKDKFTFKELGYLFSLVLIGIINYIVNDSSVILLTSLTLMLLKNMDINRCLKVILISRALGCLTLVLDVITGIIKQQEVIMWRVNQFVVRRTINNIAPNELQLNLVIIILLIIYLYRDKLNILEYVCMAIINYLLYRYTLSRTGMVIGMLAMIIGYSLTYLPITRKWIMFLARYSYIFLCLFSLGIAKIYNDGSLEKLDVLFNGRLSYMHALVSEYRVPFFGMNKNYFTNINIDNGFISLLYAGGAAAFFIISYLIISESNNLYKEKNYYSLMIILLISIYSLSESFLPNIFVNISLFFLAWRIYQEPTEKITNKDVEN